ncbi:GFA domain-containing protein [Favolaschia claudopus]|uniref:GFA domain-containing protein n=1 Tax=Favolaschia claudopus TaxID=2862362 RepID=A0AAW0EDJ6_9AGAR
MSESAEMKLKEYRGNCHCGAFKFKLKIPEIKEAHTCTCSVCAKKGYLWTFPKREQLTIVQGEEDKTLKTYLFAKKMMAHKFCPTCGTSVMEARMPGSNVPGAPEIGINIRTLEGIDLESLQINTFDGATVLQPAYENPEPVAVESIEEDATVYHGSCHCGALCYALVSDKKISQALLCDCSICSRDAVLWIYPKIDRVTFKGRESAAEYTFGKGTVYHGFCGICGVPVYERFADPEDDDVALNVRTMHGLDLAEVEMLPDKGSAMLPVYNVWGDEAA